MRPRGFTLIELLVVIAIIGLLATMSVVSFNSSRDKARISKGAGFSGQILRGVGDDVVGRWELDECTGTAAADMSGYASNGVITMGAGAWSTDTYNNKGCSINFDGLATVVDVPVSPRFNMSSFTLSAWVKTPNAGVSRRRIVSQQDGSGYWVMALMDNVLEFLSSRDTQPTYIKGGVLNDNKWHHVATVRDAGKKLYWYVDGSLIGSQDITDTAPYQIATDVFIGRHASGAAQYFTGQIDEVRVYSRALTAIDIHQMYAQGAATHLVKN